MNDYNNYYWAVAWASVDSGPIYEGLIKYQEKIKNICFGVYSKKGRKPEMSTSKSFIISILKQKIQNIHFVRIKDKKITPIHSKLYFFENSENDWECYLGSANFTNNGLYNNFEVMIKITSTDIGETGALYRYIKTYFSDIETDEKITKFSYEDLKKMTEA